MWRTVPDNVTITNESINWKAATPFFAISRTTSVTIEPTISFKLYIDQTSYWRIEETEKDLPNKGKNMPKFFFFNFFFYRHTGRRKVFPPEIHKYMHIIQIYFWKKCTSIICTYTRLLGVPPPLFGAKEFWAVKTIRKKSSKNIWCRPQVASALWPYWAARHDFLDLWL